MAKSRAKKTLGCTKEHLQSARDFSSSMGKFLPTSKKDNSGKVVVSRSDCEHEDRDLFVDSGAHDCGEFVLDSDVSLHMMSVPPTVSGLDGRGDSVR